MMPQTLPTIEKTRSNKTSVHANPVNDTIAPKFIIVVPKSILQLPKYGNVRVMIGSPATNSLKEEGHFDLLSEGVLLKVRRLLFATLNALLGFCMDPRWKKLRRATNDILLLR